MESNIIKIKIEHEKLTAIYEHELVAGSIGVVDFQAVFDQSWDDYAKKLIFTAWTANGKVVFEKIGASGQVPWEVLAAPGTLYISAVGVAEGKQQPTAVMQQGLRVVAGGALGGRQGEPTPDFENQVLSTVQEAARQVKSAESHSKSADNAAKTAKEHAKRAADAAEAARKSAQDAVQAAAMGESGAFPMLELPYSPALELPVNTEVCIGTTEGPLALTLGTAVPGYTAEWAAQITQGETAYEITMPVVEWVGDVPSFDAGTTTQIRLFYVGQTLKGVAV